MFIISVSPQYRSLKFDNLTIDDGLSNNSINCILQTKDGFLWIATKDGLNRYDGQNFKIYKNDPAIKNSLPENYVMSLMQSSDGTFWVGTWGGGLCKFDPQHENFTRYDLVITEDDYIESLFEDHSGNIWYGTMNYGLSKLNTKTRKIVSYNKSLSGNNYLPDNEITCIKEDDKACLWLGTLTTETRTTSGSPRQGIPLTVGNGYDRVVKRCMNVSDTIAYLLSNALASTSRSFCHFLHLPVYFLIGLRGPLRVRALVLVR